jgi:hypothetical protein
MPSQTVKVQTPDSTISQNEEDYSGVLIPKLVWLQEGVSQNDCGEDLLGDPVPSKNLYRGKLLEEGNLVGIRTPSLTAYPLRVDEVTQKAGSTQEQSKLYKVTLSRSNGQEIVLDFKKGSSSVVITESTPEGSSTNTVSEDDLDVCPLFDKSFVEYYNELEQFLVERL